MLASYALVRNGAGEVAAAYQMGADSLEMARRLEDPGLMVAVLSANAALYPAVEFPEEFARCAAEIQDLCATDAACGEALLGWRAGAVTPGLGAARLIRLGRGGEVDAVLAEMRRRIGERHNALEQVFLHFSFTSARVRSGDANGALEHGRQALEWAIQSQNMVVRAAGHIARGWGLLGAGRMDDALEQLEQALEIAIDRDVMKGLAVNVGLPLLAATQLRRGDLSAARAAAERGIELARVIGYRHGEATNWIALSHVQVAAGDLAAADVTLARAAELAQVLSACDLPPCIEEARAELARVRGDAAGSERALRAAAELHRANGEEWLATQAEVRIGSESQSPT